MITKAQHKLEIEETLDTLSRLCEDQRLTPRERLCVKVAHTLVSLYWAEKEEQ